MHEIKMFMSVFLGFLRKCILSYFLNKINFEKKYM